MKKLRFVSCLVICLLLFACTESSSLNKLEGSWVANVDKTVEANPSLKGNSPGDAFTKTMTVALIEGMRLHFDIKNKTISGKLIGISFSGENFGVVEDDADKCVLLVLREKLSFIPDGDTLTLKTESDSMTLVFSKEQKL